MVLDTFWFTKKTNQFYSEVILKILRSRWSLLLRALSSPLHNLLQKWSEKMIKNTK